VIANTPLGMFQEVLADRNRLIGENAQLRAELERVTAERAKDRERDTATMQTLLDIATEDLSAERAAHAKTKAALADCADRVHPDEHAATLAELDQLRRAWALRELASHTPGYPMPGLGGLPESVAALIRAGAGKPIGECESCGERAPLVTQGQRTVTLSEMICAPGWPCGTGGA